MLNAIILETLESQVQLGINGATTEKTYPTCQKDDAGSKIILAISTNRMCVGYVKFAFGWVIAPRDEVSEWGHGPSFEGAVNKAILWPRPDGSAGTQVVPVLSCKAYLQAGNNLIKHLLFGLGPRNKQIQLSCIYMVDHGGIVTLGMFFQWESDGNNIILLRVT